MSAFLNVGGITSADCSMIVNAVNHHSAASNAKLDIVIELLKTLVASEHKEEKKTDIKETPPK